MLKRTKPLHLAIVKKIILFTLILTHVSLANYLIVTFASPALNIFFVLNAILIVYLAKDRLDNYIMSQRKYNRIAALRNNGGNHTDREWSRLKLRHADCCAACHKHERVVGTLTKDHIIPLKTGGTDNISNIQPLCQSCNSIKGTRIIDYRW